MDVKSINTNENMETFESEREHFQTNSVDKRLVRNWPGRGCGVAFGIVKLAENQILPDQDEDDYSIQQQCKTVPAKAISKFHFSNIAKIQAGH